MQGWNWAKRYETHCPQYYSCKFLFLWVWFRFWRRTLPITAQIVFPTAQCQDGKSLRCPFLEVVFNHTGIEQMWYLGDAWQVKHGIWLLLQLPNRKVLTISAESLATKCVSFLVRKSLVHVPLVVLSCIVSLKSIDGFSLECTTIWFRWILLKNKSINHAIVSQNTGQ